MKLVKRMHFSADCRLFDTYIKSSTSLAEKDTCRVIRYLAQDLYRQMGVRLFILASYEDSNDETVAG